jgi:Fe-S cluster assembly protein SufD
MSAVAENVFAAGFNSAAAVSGVAWLDRRRADAFKHFREGGIPHRRIEEWKYSDLRTALESPRTSSTVLKSIADPFATIGGVQFSLKDGRLCPNVGEVLPHGVELVDLAALSEDTPAWVKSHLGEVLKSDSIGQASLALMRGGVAFRITAELTTPLRLRFLQRDDAVHSRVLVVVEEDASLLLLESHAPGGGLANIGMELVLAPNARVTHVRLADSPPEAIHLEEIGIRAGRDAKYRAHFAQTGAKLARLELTIALEAEGAEAELGGAAALADGRHSDITTHVTHAAAKTTSRQLFKYVADNHARAIYQGKITVAKGADGSDSRQTAKAVLLGDRAEADLKPELEILADDVKCAHGAAIGDLDADSLFYLRARGIPENDARGLLLRAFLEEVVADVANDDIRAAMWRFIGSGLSQKQEVAQ